MSKRSRRKGPTSRDTRRDAIKAKRAAAEQAIVRLERNVDEMRDLYRWTRVDG